MNWRPQGCKPLQSASLTAFKTSFGFAGGFFQLTPTISSLAVESWIRNVDEALDYFPLNVGASRLLGRVGIRLW